MRNLLEKLKPEYKEKFHLIKEEYPASVQYVYQQLEKHEWILDINFKTVSDMCFWLNIEMSFNNINNLFEEQ